MTLNAAPGNRGGIFAFGASAPVEFSLLGAFFESPVEWAVANYGKDTNHEHSSLPCDRRRSMLVLGLNEEYVKRWYGRGR